MTQIVLEVNAVTYAALGVIAVILVAATLFLFWTATWFLRNIFVWVAFGLIAVALIAFYIVYFMALG